jgi:hypothetical protein
MGKLGEAFKRRWLPALTGFGLERLWSAHGRVRRQIPSRHFTSSLPGRSPTSGIPQSDISIVSNNVDNRYDDDRPTKVAEDAGKGAGIGAAVGGIGGLLTGLGLMAIPGVGPVVAGGWLVATAAAPPRGRPSAVLPVGLSARSQRRACANATPISMPKACGAAAPLSLPGSRTRGHRQLGKILKRYKWVTPTSAAKPTAKSAGTPSTKMHRHTRRSRSQRSGRAISEQGFSRAARGSAHSRVFQHRGGTRDQTCSIG